MYFCFIFMFLILLEWFYKLRRQFQPTRLPHGTASPPGRRHHFLPSKEAAHHFLQKGVGFCSFPGSRHLSMNENQRKWIFKQVWVTVCIPSLKRSWNSSFWRILLKWNCRYCDWYMFNPAGWMAMLFAATGLECSAPCESAVQEHLLTMTRPCIISPHHVNLFCTSVCINSSCSWPSDILGIKWISVKFPSQIFFFGKFCCGKKKEIYHQLNTMRTFFFFLRISIKTKILVDSSIQTLCSVLGWITLIWRFSAHPPCQVGWRLLWDSHLRCPEMFGLWLDSCP